MTSENENSTLLKTALKAIDGYNKWNIDAILEPRAGNCTQRVYPARLDRPELDNQGYREMMSGILPLFTRFRVEILDVVEDAKNHKVAFHAKSSGETAIGEYGNEYMIILEMTEDDQRVVKIKEFVDSGYSQDYFTRLRAHVAAKNERS